MKENEFLNKIKTGEIKPKVEYVVDELSDKYFHSKGIYYDDDISKWIIYTVDMPDDLRYPDSNKIVTLYITSNEDMAFDKFAQLITSQINDDELRSQYAKQLYKNMQL